MFLPGFLFTFARESYQVNGKFAAVDGTRPSAMGIMATLVGFVTPGASPEVARRGSELLRLEKRRKIMIKLTQEQHQVLAQQGPSPVRAIDPITHEEYVLVPVDVYDRLQHLVQEDTGLSRKEEAFLVERAMKEYDANDPSLELYQHD
jgi:hypothetical protein